MSNKFTASNGVKQGSILSPILFSVYMDELFERLEKSGVGCHMGNHYTGSLGYADDLTLLAPTLSGLQVLIKICERYADEFDIKFNGAKSVYMVFGGRRCKCDNRTVMVNGAELHRVNATVHLGPRRSNGGPRSGSGPSTVPIRTAQPQNFRPILNSVVKRNNIIGFISTVSELVLISSRIFYTRKKFR